MVDSAFADSAGLRDDGRAEGAAFCPAVHAGEVSGFASRRFFFTDLSLCGSRFSPSPENDRLAPENSWFHQGYM